MVKALKLCIAGVDIQTTVSIGVANRASGMENEDGMLKDAERALYAAKSASRDRVCLFANVKTHCA